MKMAFRQNNEQINIRQGLRKAQGEIREAKGTERRAGFKQGGGGQLP